MSWPMAPCRSSAWPRAKLTGAIAEREGKGETVETTFVGLDKVEIKDALIKGKTVQITVKFLSKLITATRNAKGEIVKMATSLKVGEKINLDFSAGSASAITEKITD